VSGYAIMFQKGLTLCCSGAGLRRPGVRCGNAVIMLPGHSGRMSRRTGIAEMSGFCC